MSGITGAYDSTTQLLVPALQAAATILILEKQKDQYDDIADQRIGLIDSAVTKYINGMDALVTSGLMGEAMGTVPDAAIFQEVDSRQTIYAAINENLQNIPAAERHIAAVNRMNENNDIVRMTAFSPEFIHILHTSSSSIRDLINGKLPIDTLIDITTDVAENDQLNGRIGNSSRVTHRSIGLTRIQMMDKGRRAMSHHIEMAQRVSPIQRQQGIQEMLGTPQGRIGLALTQAQLIQTSLQNFHNLEATGAPAKLGELQMDMQKLTARLGMEAQRGNMVNQFVPNYGALLAPQIASISEGLLGSGERTGADTGAGNSTAASQETSTNRQPNFNKDFSNPY